VTRNSNLAEVVARTVAINRAGDPVAMRTAARLDECPAIVAGTIRICDACEASRKAGGPTLSPACIGDGHRERQLRRRKAEQIDDGPSYLAIFGRGQP
jgi:hypothetical protein